MSLRARFFIQNELPLTDNQTKGNVNNRLYVLDANLGMVLEMSDLFHVSVYPY